MTILYPGSFINYKNIDEDMRAECLAAVETGLFQIMLFNFDEWLGGEKLKLVNAENCSEAIIYRGWMLRPEQYKRLYRELSARNIKLVTTPEQYEYMHIFPNVYPDIKEDTASIMVFNDRKVDVDAVKKRFNKFIVKDSVKSVKGTEFPAYFDQSITQAEFDTWMEVFYKYRGDLLTGGICIKEYMQLKKYGDHTNEYRVFYANHQIISLSKNSNQPGYADQPPQRLVEKYKGLNSPYYTIDFAQLADDSWMIIEAGDGGVSGLSPGQDMGAYFRSLFHVFKSFSQEGL